MPTKVFPGKYSSLAEISDFIAENTKLAGFDEKETYAVQLAVDEACSNIIEHSYGEELAGEIECDCQSSETGITIVLKDSGKPFSPEDVPELEVGIPLFEVRERGAGLFLMKKLMDEVQFDFPETGGTTLTMIKNKKR
ncbi:MAG: ATP-binding protein [Anaerolineales bacterium]|nr:ATP-binding protein [Anaerolineales bacterium]